MLNKLSATTTSVRLYFLGTVASSLGPADPLLSPRPFTLVFCPGPPAPLEPSFLGPIPNTLLARI